MAKKSTAHSVSTTTGDAAIVIVVQERNGVVCLDPKPRRQRVRQGRTLVILAINLTHARREVELKFATPIDLSQRRTVRGLSVEPGEVNYLKVKIKKDMFKDVPKGINLIGVPYEVIVDDVVVDPDLEIER